MRFNAEIQIEEMNFDKEAILIRSALPIDETYKIIEQLKNKYPYKPIIMLPISNTIIQSMDLDKIIKYLQDLKEE